MSYKEKPLSPEACGTCSACRKSENDPWRCNRPWRVGNLLGPLDTWYDPKTGLKKVKGFSSNKNYGNSYGSYGNGKSFGMDSYFDKQDRGIDLDADSWDTADDDYKPSKGKVSTVPYEKCAHSHPPLEIEPGFTIYGGAAASPVVKDCDIYVALDSYSGGEIKAYPWNTGGPIIVNFPITDMQVPKDVGEFKKMIAWLKVQGQAGKKIHVGCIGGHGRTGTLLAALMKEVTGNVDAISYVRKNYCTKAVESDAQVRFLAKEFGIKEEKGAKSYGGGKGGKEFIYDSNKGYTVEKPSSQIGKFNERFKDLFGGKEVTLPIDPVGKKGNIWGSK
jgi:hypothetical protein